MLRIITLALVAVSLAGAQQVQEDNPDAQLVEQYVKDYEKLFDTTVPSDNRQQHSVNPEDIKFVFYNAPGFGDVVSTHVSNASDLPPDVYNPEYETKFYIHGWLLKDDQEMFKYAVMQYAIRGKRINFVVVDWSKHFGLVGLFKETVPAIAEYVSQMVQKLRSRAPDAKPFHMIGFGVGAHIAGLAGKKLQPKVNRITGLSPFGPYYNYVNESERLAKGDADFVDVIHTDMGFFCISKPIGDIDFLPAGGKLQPAAKDNLLQHLKSHLMAKYYFMESIDLGFSFIGKYCESYREFLSNACLFNTPEIMGEYNTRAATGKVFLEVNAEKPYGKGVAGEFGSNASPREEETKAKRNAYRN